MSAPDAADPRRRGKVNVAALRTAAAPAPPGVSSRMPVHMALALLFTKTLVASAAWLARQWLFMPHLDALDHAPRDMLALHDAQPAHEPPKHPQTSTWAVASFSIATAAIVLLAGLRVWRWHIEWSATVLTRLGALATLEFAQLLAWLTALRYLGATHTLIFTQSCEIWARDVAGVFRRKTSGSLAAVGALALTAGITLLTHSAVSIRRPFGEPDDDTDTPLTTLLRTAEKQTSTLQLALGFAALALYACLACERRRTTFFAAREVGGRRRAVVLATALAATVVLPLSCAASMLGCNALPLPVACVKTLANHNATDMLQLLAYPVLALGPLVCEPLVGLTLETHISLHTYVLHAWSMAVLAAMLIGFAAFGINVSLVQACAAVAVFLALRSVLRHSPVYFTSWYRSQAYQAGSQLAASMPPGTEATPLTDVVVHTIAALAQLRAIIAEILRVPDSRRIFQFLCLNLAFMGVQLVWGVWTNSLGLISDAIHMFFDCAAIFMGLCASVMAAWPNDDRFPFGYARVETLSGFANGLFLILISIFIVFESIQRIIKPPVMGDIVQLLIVSTLGLAVNLFGMFAMGHHHHHGHSCGHGHDHAHDHAHAHGHDHGHHSHNMVGLYLHILADTLGSVGVIASTVLIHFFHWTGFDPIASLLIAVLIIASVVPLVVESGRILCLDIGDTGEQAFAHALAHVLEIDGVQGYSYPRIWSLDGTKFVGSIHVHVDADTLGPDAGALDPEAVIAEVDRVLKHDIHGLVTLTVQLDIL